MDLSIKKIREMECILRCDHHKLYLEVENNQGSELTTLVQCTYCDLVFEHPRPSKQQIDLFYKNVDLWLNSKDIEGNTRSYVKELSFKKPIFSDLVRRIEQRKSGGSVLDIGAGPGLLELEMNKKRWQVQGIEKSDYIATFGREQLGTNVITGLFEDKEFPLKSFDVIVMKYVLDHMENPFESLVKTRKLIKDNGVLLIADLINIDSFCARFFGEGHRLIHPMHFTYFSPQTITYHLERIGFKVVKIEYPYILTPYFTASNIMTLIKRVGERVLNKYLLKNNNIVFSVPFYGNMMDVWAVPFL